MRRVAEPAPRSGAARPWHRTVVKLTHRELLGEQAGVRRARPRTGRGSSRSRPRRSARARDRTPPTSPNAGPARHNIVVHLQDEGAGPLAVRVAVHLHDPGRGVQDVELETRRRPGPCRARCTCTGAAQGRARTSRRNRLRVGRVHPVRGDPPGRTSALRRRHVRGLGAEQRPAPRGRRSGPAGWPSSRLRPHRGENRGPPEVKSGAAESARRCRPQRAKSRRMGREDLRVGVLDAAERLISRTPPRRSRTCRRRRCVPRR